MYQKKKKNQTIKNKNKKNDKNKNLFQECEEGKATALRYKTT